MKLVRIQIKDYRTFGGTQAVEISGGVNCFVGPNNCGKSNLFNAVALALDPASQWNREEDLPAFMLGGRPPVPRLDLTFALDDTVGHERTLLDRADAYEKVVSGGAKTYADVGQIRLVVTFAGGTPQRTFVARGAGARTAAGDSAEFRRLESQFRQVMRFVMIRSGESLQSLLAGRFREILQLVIADHLREELGQVEDARVIYREALQARLLVPLRERIAGVVGELFPEITAAELVPTIPTIAQTLANVDVRLRDAAITDMERKGTGVRGAVLAAMLQYLADQTRRSIVFAVEEPEAFLHPGAQEDLRESLENLAARKDVTLLVTTHSPFIVSRKPEARVVEIRKDSRGCSAIAATASGDAEHVELLGGLFRDPGLPALIDRALAIPKEASAVIVTEGYTDAEYLRIAAKLAGRDGHVDCLHIVAAGGTSKIVLQCLLLKNATSIPVIALLDNDANGRGARDQLSKFNWSNKREIVVLSNVKLPCKNHDAEAEDLWPMELMSRMVASLGADNVLDGTIKCGKGWHYSITKAAKLNVLEWIRREARPSDTSHWMELLDIIHGRINLIGHTGAAQESAGG